MDSTFNALAAALRRIKREAIAAAPTADPDDVIADAALLQPWVPGNYTTGDVRVQDGYPYKCCQAHDSSNNPDWDPVTQRALWVPYHAKTAKWALPYVAPSGAHDACRCWGGIRKHESYVAPSGAHDAYQTGEYMIWSDGQIYLCNTDNTVWGPDVLPDAWEVVQDV